MGSSDEGKYIEGLVEFYVHWPALRVQAIALSRNEALTEEQTEIVEWMVRVIDRVGPADLNEDG